MAYKIWILLDLFPVKSPLKTPLIHPPMTSMTLSQKAHGKIIILVRVDVLASVSPINHFVIYAHILIVFPDGMAVFYFNPDLRGMMGLDFKYTGKGKAEVNK